MKANVKRVGLRTAEGGAAIPISNPLALLRKLTTATLLWEKGGYCDGRTIESQILPAVHACDPQDVMRLAYEIRTTHGLRSVAMYLFACLASHPIKSEYKYALRETIQRPDDMTELLAMLYPTGDRRNTKQCLPHQILKAFKMAMGKFDAYQLAKYSNTGALFSLRDVLQMTHPKPVDEERSALYKQLRENTLPTPDTWDAALSSGADKRETFTRLIETGKLGGLATLRNLRNMATAGVDDAVIEKGIAMSAERRFVPFPYQYYMAAKVVPRYEKDLDKAMIASANKQCAGLAGKTVLLVDVSGSMFHGNTEHGASCNFDLAGALAVITREVCQYIRIFTFSNFLVELETPHRGFPLIRQIDHAQPHSGTRLGEALQSLSKRVHDADRIIVLTDEQSTDNVGAPPYKSGYLINVSKTNRNIGFGPWNRISGWSEGVLKFINAHEELVKEQS